MSLPFLENSVTDFLPPRKWCNMCLDKLERFIRPSRIVPILRTRSGPDLYQVILPPRKQLALGRERILIPEFIRVLPTLAVYDVVHSLPLGGVDRDFSTKDERHFSFLSGSFREHKKTHTHTHTHTYTHTHTHTHIYIKQMRWHPCRIHNLLISKGPSS